MLHLSVLLWQGLEQPASIKLLLPILQSMSVLFTFFISQHTDEALQLSRHTCSLLPIEKAYHIGTGLKSIRSNPPVEITGMDHENWKQLGVAKDGQGQGDILEPTHSACIHTVKLHPHSMPPALFLQRYLPCLQHHCF